MLLESFLVVHGKITMERWQGLCCMPHPARRLSEKSYQQVGGCQRFGSRSWCKWSSFDGSSVRIQEGIARRSLFNFTLDGTGESVTRTTVYESSEGGSFMASNRDYSTGGMGSGRGFDLDDDPGVNPSTEEVPGNGVDDDCDGRIDGALCFVGIGAR